MGSKSCINDSYRYAESILFAQILQSTASILIQLLFILDFINVFANALNGCNKIICNNEFIFKIVSFTTDASKIMPKHLRYTQN